MFNTHTSRWLCLLTSLILVGSAYSAGFPNPGVLARLKGVSGGFSPTSITGLYAWYRDDQLGVGDGNPVTTWTDVQNSKDETQSTAGKKPLLRTTGGPTSTTAVEFDGTDDSMGSSATLDLSTGLKFAISFWLYWNAYGTDDDIAMEFSSNTSNGNGWYVDPNAAGGNLDLVINTGVGLNANHIARPPAAEWVHYVINWDIGIGAGAEVASCYTNNVAATVVNDISFNNTAALAADTLYLMARNNASLFGGGKLHNVMVFTNMNLTAQNISDLFTYK